ncbi:MAG: hypothetical protein HC772_04420 [Leptolyngbyaceae cyanobacterium CRU_2_3]|nr:hypothetical protein [Leptolyngbyaceae cyanobacterium CRU_2_3]
MLFSILSLAIAISAIYLSYKLTDEIMRLLIKLIGLFSLVLSLVYALWLIQLLVVMIILVTSNCAQPHCLRRINCSSFCASRSNCPSLPV